MRIKTTFLATFSTLLFVFFIQCSNQQSSSDLLVFSGSTMGTYYSVKIVKADLNQTGTNPEIIQQGIEDVLRAVNLQMSTYIDSSEISRFNRYRKSDWFAVSADLATVIDRALQISRESNGAFDITVGPLVNLWGFGPGEREERIPTPEEIAAARAKTGYRKLQVRLSPPAVKKTLPEIYCDLSAIAKGFGVDKVAEYLTSQQVQNYLVEIGGEIRAGGENTSGKDWRIGISSPDDDLGIEKVISVKNMAVATSGDYRNYFEKDGIRYSHTIDPHTGRPITHHLASVTVADQTCIMADGYATAIDVLGPDAGYDFAIRKELPVFMIVRDKHGFIEKMTPQFEKIFMK